MRWRFDGEGTALGTRIGHRHDGAIHVAARKGCALFGPYLAMPAGRLEARVLLAPGGRGAVEIEITQGGGTRLASAGLEIDGRRSIALAVDLKDAVDGLEVRLWCRGTAAFAILGLELDLVRAHVWSPPEPSRAVGTESGKTYAQKIADGFFDRYLSGPAVMEVGYKGYDHRTVPIVPQAIGVDVGYPGYDGRHFPFADASLDAIYSSHCYEHIPDWRAVLRDWHRLLRIGGFLVIVVPHQHLFERKRSMPSRWNPDHQRFYTPRSLLGELEAALDENSYRIRHLVENDAGFDYRPTPREGSSGCFEIELVVEKIARPQWLIDDGAVRPYPPADFQVAPGQTLLSPYELRVDLGTVGCLVWGPYCRLAAGRYEAEFFFDGALAVPAELMLEVACDMVGVAIAHVRLVPGEDRHRVTLRFASERDESFFEFRITNRVAVPGATISFRGVELRYARETDGQPASP